MGQSKVVKRPFFSGDSARSGARMMGNTFLEVITTFACFLTEPTCFLGINSLCKCQLAPDLLERVFLIAFLQGSKDFFKASDEVRRKGWFPLVDTYACNDYFLAF